MHRQDKLVQPKGRLNMKWRRATEDPRGKDEIYKMIYENNKIFQHQEKQHITSFQKAQEK